MRRNPAGVAWIRAPIAAVAMVGSNRVAGSRFVFDPRGIADVELGLRGIRRGGLRALERSALRRAGMVVATTPEFGDWLTSRGARSISVLPNCAEPIPRRTPPVSSGLRVIYSGSAEPWQANEDAAAWIAALREIADRPVFATALLRGTDDPGPLAESADEVILDGARELVCDRLSQAHVGVNMVLPQWNKVVAAYPVKAAEYAAAGIVLLVNWDLPVHARLTAGGRLGCLVPLDVRTLSTAALRRVWDDLVRLAAAPEGADLFPRGWRTVEEGGADIARLVAGLPAS